MQSTNNCENEQNFNKTKSIYLDSWDEWVAESRVLKFNEANVQKQQELQKQHKLKNKKGEINYF